MSDDHEWTEQNEGFVKCQFLNEIFKIEVYTIGLFLRERR